MHSGDCVITTAAASTGPSSSHRGSPRAGAWGRCRREQQPLDPVGDPEPGRPQRRRGRRYEAGCGQREQRTHDGVRAVPVGGGIVGAHLGQPRQLDGALGEQPQSGQGRSQRPGNGQQLVVAPGQVGAFVDQDRGELGLVERGQGPTGDHNGGRAAGQAVHVGLCGIDHDSSAGTAGRPARGQHRRLGMAAGVPAGPADPAPDAHGQHGQGQHRRRGHRGDAGLQEPAVPDDRRRAEDGEAAREQPVGAIARKGTPSARTRSAASATTFSDCRATSSGLCGSAYRLATDP